MRFKKSDTWAVERALQNFRNSSSDQMMLNDMIWSCKWHGDGTVTVRNGHLAANACEILEKDKESQ